MPKISLLDTFALAWFILCWAGYAYYADRGDKASRGLSGATHQYRLQWMRELVKRENRIVDSGLIGNLMNSVSFFASTTILILAGLITVLGSTEQAIEITSDLPFARETSRELWELKLLLLLMIFVYAFFKFTWSLRQFNLLSILIGSAPSDVENVEDHKEFIVKAAQMNALAGDDFNRGVRAYYFGLAALTWFIQPWLFVFFSALIVVVLYRRDFASPTLKVLQGDEKTLPGEEQR